jgi:hypothetical protein
MGCFGVGLFSFVALYAGRVVPLVPLALIAPFAGVGAGVHAVDVAEKRHEPRAWAWVSVGLNAPGVVFWGLGGIDFLISSPT